MSSEAAEVEPLACPTCARKYPLSERFCAECRMPLVYVGRGDEQPITESHERARKVRPEYIGGELVKAVMAANLAEAELIQGMLLEEGVPSILRRSPGFDVPDFLAAGPRDVFVPLAGAAAAHDVLLSADMAPQERPAGEMEGGDAGHAARLVAAILGGGAITALVAWALLQLGG